MAKAKGKKQGRGEPATELTDLLRVPAGPVDLTTYDTRGTPGFTGDKLAAKQQLATMAPTLSDLQERLYATGRTGGKRRLLFVVQGMDTSGKGGVMRHAVGLMDPQGLRIKAFKAPTPEEKRRGFLWRVRQAQPLPGEVGVYDRSHYEDVLVARVRNLAPAAKIDSRYAAINDYEAKLVASGCAVIKVMLHISRDEQKARLTCSARRPHQTLEVQPRRRRRSGAVGRLPAGLPDCARAVQHRRSAVAPRPRGSEVVPQLGGDPAAHRAHAGDGLAVADSEFRRRGGTAASGRYVAAAKVTTSPTTITAGGWIFRSAARSAIVASVPTVSRLPGP